MERTKTNHEYQSYSYSQPEINTMYSKQILSTLLLASSAFTGSAASLRGNRRRLADNSECTILVAEYLQIPGETAAPEASIDCGMDDGMIYNIQATVYQKEVLKQKLKHEEITSGSTFTLNGVTAIDKILVKNSGKICSMRAIKYDFCLRLNPTVYFPFLRNRHSKVVSYSYLKS